MELLVFDDERLPEQAKPQEQALANSLGEVGLAAVDHALLSVVQDRWLKVARIVLEAISSHKLARDDAAVHLVVRRIIALADKGRIETKGDLRRPRFSEARLPP